MLPNFFVVGAPKAGTTSLYNYLDQHPAIYMSPVKEPAFFAPDLVELKQQLGIAEPDDTELRAYLDGPMTQRRSGVVTEWEQYLKLFGPRGLMRPPWGGEAAVVSRLYACPGLDSRTPSTRGNRHDSARPG